MAAKSYRIKIAKQGEELEAEGDKSFVLEMVARFGPHSDLRASSLPSPKSDKAQTPKPMPQPSKGKLLSIREFVQQLDLKRHTDITLAFGYFLEKFGGISEFSPADINNCYYEAKLETSNTSQMIIQNIKKGLLMASRKKGEKGQNRYSLTRSGEQYIDSILRRAQ